MEKNSLQPYHSRRISSIAPRARNTQITVITSKCRHRRVFFFKSTGFFSANAPLARKNRGTQQPRNVSKKYRR